MQDPQTIPTPDFLTIAIPLIERGLWITPVEPHTKVGCLKNLHAMSTVDEVTQWINKNPKYKNHNVGVTSFRGVGRHCFLDVDAPGVVQRIEMQSRHRMPDGYKISSSPMSKPYKTHFYLRQTAYSYKRFGAWNSKNRNVKDLEKLDEKGNHPTLYDVKGIGGIAFVVGEGSVKENGEVYTCVEDGPIPDIPDWLVDWLVLDINKFIEGKNAEYLKKLKAKEQERKRFTAYEREQMRKKNLLEGFDIYFEDRYEYLSSRAFELSSNGLGPESLEVALHEMLEKDVVGGREYAKTEKGKNLIHKLAYDPRLNRGDASWFYKNKDKPLSTKPLVLTKKQTRRTAMADVIRQFPNRIDKTTALNRVISELKGWGTRLNGSFRQDLRRARKDAGFKIQGKHWVRANA